MSEQPDQPILILGMHRSGTSFLANLMQSLGVFIGDDLVGSQKGNPRGHFEARPMLEFHQRLIAARCGDARKAFDEDMLVQESLSQELTAEEKAEAMDLIGAMRREGPWGWKEPRTCLFLHTWLELLPQSRLLMVYRHPLEVQQSMLRRSHWDLALFPDQAMQSYAVHNQALLEKADEAFVFNANAGFGDLPHLAEELASHFDLTKPEKLPEFHQKEFQTLGISRAMHELFSLFQPEAAAVFDQLQEKAAIPYKWAGRDDDGALEELSGTLSSLLEGLPAAGRAFFMPVLDWWASGRDGAILDHYTQLASDIGDHIRQVKEWNEEAAVIFEENKRLAADYEKMGTEFAQQQEFLAKQATTQAKVWNELKQTGDSWKEQREYIKSVHKEREHLLEQIEELKKKLASKETSGE
ncbi:MAG: sulfotransferase [Puniceicoccaceae bacterium]